MIDSATWTGRAPRDWSRPRWIVRLFIRAAT